MWKLRVVDDESNPTVVKLVRADYTLGRSEESTIRLTERNISREHARLFTGRDSVWHLEDKDSYLGSYVNGTRIKEQTELHHGDTIQLGDYRLELSDESQAEVDAKALDDAVSAAQLPDRLVVVQGPDIGTVFPLTGQKLLVGRGEECQVALDDASVSRVHVEIMRTEHGLMILDQGSSNGLRINGVDLPSAMLRSGDVVELGDVRLKFVPSGMEDVSVVAVPQNAGAAEAVPAAVAGLPGIGRNHFLFYIGGGALLAAIVAVAVFNSGGGESSASSSAKKEPAPLRRKSDSLKKKLGEAEALALEGAVVMAHRRLQEIPADSPLRQTKPFREIERRWAAELIKAAQESPDKGERRRLLEKVARTTEVEAALRMRASRLLDEMTDKRKLLGVKDLLNAEEAPPDKPSRKKQQVPAGGTRKAGRKPAPKKVRAKTGSQSAKAKKALVAKGTAPRGAETSRAGGSKSEPTPKEAPSADQSSAATPSPKTGGTPPPKKSGGADSEPKPAPAKSTSAKSPSTNSSSGDKAPSDEAARAPSAEKVPEGEAPPVKKPAPSDEGFVHTTPF